MIQLDLEKNFYNLNDLKILIEYYYILKSKELLKGKDNEDFNKIVAILIEYIDEKKYFPLNPLGRPLKKHEKLSFAAREYFSEVSKKIDKKEKIYFLCKKYGSTTEKKNFEEDLENKKEIIESFFSDCFEDIIRSKNSSLCWKIRIFYAPKNSPKILEQIEELNGELEKKIEEALKKELGEEDYKDLKGKLGFCHRYWAKKKKILREEYGINWYTPTECNPGVMFD